MVLAETVGGATIYGELTYLLKRYCKVLNFRRVLTMLQTHPPDLKGPPTAFQEQVPDAGQAAAAPDPGPGSGL